MGKKPAVEPQSGWKWTDEPGLAVNSGNQQHGKDACVYSIGTATGRQFL